MYKSVSASKCAICGKDAKLTTSKLGNLNARFFSKKCFAKYWKVRVDGVEGKRKELDQSPKPNSLTAPRRQSQKKYCSVDKKKAAEKQKKLLEAAKEIEKKKGDGTGAGTGEESSGVAGAAAEAAAAGTTEDGTEKKQENAAQDSAAAATKEATPLAEVTKEAEEFHDCI